MSDAAQQAVNSVVEKSNHDMHFTGDADFSPIAAARALSHGSNGRGAPPSPPKPEPAPEEQTAEPAQTLKDAVKAAAEETTKEPPAETKRDEWAEKFDKFSKQDMALREREKKLEEQAAALKKHEADVAEVARLRELAKSNPLEFVKAVGTSPEEIAKWKELGGPDPRDEIKRLAAEQAAWREEQKQANEELRARQEAIWEATQTQKAADKWESEFNALIASDDYKMVRDWDGGREMIIGKVAAHYKENKVLLNPREELDKLKSDLKARLDKMKSYLEPAAPQPKDNSGKKTTPEKQSPGPQTITPRLGASVQRRSRYMEEDEEMARLAAKYSR